MKSLAKASLLILGLLALAACGPASAAPVVASVDLAGTSWVLSSLAGDLPLPGTTVTLQFGQDGTVAGSDGCNRFSTTFTQAGYDLTINQPAASTMMACLEPVMDQAVAFMGALERTSNFSGTERQLILQDGNQILATFVASSQNLAGTSWEVTSYNNGRDAVVSVLLGTEIYADFSAAGQVSGNAGCNDYFASYSVAGAAIEIGQAGTTLRLCPEPPGVMEQEAEYLAALASAATFSVEGSLLQMRTAADQLAVLMTRRLVVDLPTPAPEPDTPRGRVTAAQGVNIRSGPGVNYPVVGFARTGDEGEIVGRSADGRWWAAAVPSAPGGVGWVSADFVAATKVANVPVLNVPPPVVVPPVATPPATPTPVPPPTATPEAQLSLWADRTTIDQGQCTTLNWSVENVQAVWVYPRGADFTRFPRTGQGSEPVCPTETTTYEMRVLQRDGSTVFREVTINVVGQAPTATATPVPPTATPAPPPTATPAPPAAPDLLSGTRWNVIQYNNFAGGIVTLLPDTNITIDFGAGGQLSGNGGCNTFFGSFQVDGNNVTIVAPAGASALCTEPEGIMEQESAFLNALQASATYRITGDTLELVTAGGQIAVVATRIP